MERSHGKTEYFVLQCHRKIHLPSEKKNKKIKTKIKQTNKQTKIKQNKNLSQFWTKIFIILKGRRHFYSRCFYGFFIEGPAYFFMWLDTEKPLVRRCQTYTFKYEWSPRTYAYFKLKPKHKFYANLSIICQQSNDLMPLHYQKWFNAFRPN